jgi:hypothetical protein
MIVAPPMVQVVQTALAQVPFAPQLMRSLGRVVTPRRVDEPWFIAASSSSSARRFSWAHGGVLRAGS